MPLEFASERLSSIFGIHKMKSCFYTYDMEKDSKKICKNWKHQNNTKKVYLLRIGAPRMTHLQYT